MTAYAGLDDRLLVVGRSRGLVPKTALQGRDVQCVAASPAAPRRVFVGTASSGLHRSTTGGETWSVVGSFHSASERVTSVAVSPQDAETVYVGTEPSRVYVSRNGGDDWTHLPGLADLSSASRWSYPPRPETHHVRWVCPHPTDPETVYVAIEAGAFVRTHDGGETWLDHPDGGPRDPHTLATHPDAPERVYVAGGDGYRESADGGETWERPDEGLDHGYVWGVAVDPADPETVVVSAAAGASDAHRPDRARSWVYRRQGGGEWERAMTGLGDPNGLLRAVFATDGRPGRFYALTNRGLFRSDDAAESWHSAGASWPADSGDSLPRGLQVV